MAERPEPKRTRGRPRAGDGGAGVQALDRGMGLRRALARAERTTLTEIASERADVYAERTLNGLTLHYADPETDKELAAVPIATASAPKARARRRPSTAREKRESGASTVPI